MIALTVVIQYNTEVLITFPRTPRQSSQLSHGTATVGIRTSQKFGLRVSKPPQFCSTLWLLNFLQCFDTVGCVIWPVKSVPDITYNVFGGTLNLALSIYLSRLIVFRNSRHQHGWMEWGWITPIFELWLPIDGCKNSLQETVPPAAQMCLLEGWENADKTRWPYLIFRLNRKTAT